MRSLSPNPQSLVRPLIRRLHPYVPGEQPKIKGLIKLNTNENPFPPSPKVMAAIRSGIDGRLRLYPNPTAQPLRDKLAQFHKCKPDNIIVGNGSDELLAMVTRAFTDPHGLTISSTPPYRSTPKKQTNQVLAACPASCLVQYFTPSYSLYPVLAEIHGAHPNPVPLESDFGLPSIPSLRRDGRWNFQAALSYVTTPNAPSGRGYATAQLQALCQAHRGVLILDEAYVDFADENALSLALKYPHVLVARTFSKAYSLCFLRIGYMVGHPDLIAALQKIRDSYNVNGLGQLAAEATLSDLPYYRANFRRIIATRQRVSRELAQLGFHVCPSQTNFILARPPAFTAQSWLEKLRDRKILVRWFSLPEVRDYLRITIGTDADADALIEAAKRILKMTAGRVSRAEQIGV